jgi:ribosomal-protein-alanine N-acetyltransferase
MPGSLVADGDDVSLRIAERADAPFLQRAGADPALRYPLGGRVFTIDELEERIVDSDVDRFLICRDDDEAGRGPSAELTEPIGAVTVEDAGWKRPELTYWIVPEAQGQGYGGEGVELAVEYAFRSYEAPAVGAAAYAFNDASQGLLRSIGFEQEGVRRDYMFVDGAYRDYVVYGLRRADWTPLSERS